MIKFFLKKTILPLLQTSTLVTLSVSIAFAIAPSTYENYVEDKEESISQFDFDTNDISDSEILLDGYRDGVYGDPVLSFGTKTSDNYNVDLYTYHSNQALYMFFDVNDKKVTKRAIGNNNAQDEDGVEISIDVLLNGGTTPQTDDLKIYLGVSGFDKVLKGNGKAWGTTMIGFGGELKTSLKYGTIPNDNTKDDTGYCLEYRIPYISLYGEANKESPFAFSFVESYLDDVTGSRKREGMSGHNLFKVPYEYMPYAYPVLTKSNRFYSRADYANLNEAFPSVTGKVFGKDGEPIYKAQVQGYYSKTPTQKFDVETDSQGFFFFENVETTDDFIVEVSKIGFDKTKLIYDAKNLVNANGVEYYQDFVLMSTGSETKTISGKVKARDGIAKDNFKVELFGHESISTTTDSNGAFSLNVYKDVVNKIKITKANFESEIISVEVDATELADVMMYSQLVNLAVPINKVPSLNYIECGVSRSDDNILVRLESPYLIEDDEVASLYVNTSEKTGFNSFRNGDYRVDYDGKEVKVYSFNEDMDNFVYDSEKSLLTSVTTSLDVLYETRILISNEALGLTSSKTFGAAFDYFNGIERQVSTSGNNIIVDEEIDPLSTATYLRIAGDGKCFFSNTNSNTEFLYYYHAIDGAINEDIPNNADRIYLSYDRDETGLILKVMVNGIEGIEGINLLLNLDSYFGTGWNLYDPNDTSGTKSYYDINFRIYSDDTICYINSNDVRNKAKDQMWWSDKAHNNGVAANFTLTSKTLGSENYTIEQESGYKVYTLLLSYDLLKQCGGAPDSVLFDEESNISACIYEVSETSKTTIRFYTSSGNGWVFEDMKLSKVFSGTFSSQKNYISLPKK